MLRSPILLTAILAAALPSAHGSSQVTLGPRTNVSTAVDLDLRPDAAVDLDGDGVRDIVVAVVTSSAPPVPDSATLGFALGLGARRFGRVQEIDVAGAVEQPFATADLDGDGDVDLIGARVAPDRRLLVLENNGAGDFIVRPGPLQEEARDFVLGDVDGDGDLDLFFSGREVVPGTPVPAVRVATLDGVDWTGAVVDSGLQGPGFDVGDIDGDGRVDAANYTRTTRAYALSGGSGFAAPVALPAPLSVSDPSPALQVEDVTGDGVGDVVLFDLSEVWIGGSSAPLATAPLLAPPQGDLRGARVADLDGDGAMDLLFPISLQVGRAPGTGVLPFTASPGAVAGISAADLRGRLALIDADADGALDRPRDAFTGSFGFVRRNESIFYGTGSGFFAASVLPDFLEAPGNEPLGRVVALDVLQDGDPDLLATSAGGWVALESLGQSGFVQRPAVTGTTSALGARPVAVDADGDGFGEVVVLERLAAPRLIRFDLDTQWGFRELQTVPVPGAFQIADVGDADGDGFDDVLCATQAGGVLFPGGTGGLGAGIPLPAGFYVGSDLADADGDGDLDIFGLCSTYENLGGLAFVERSPCVLPGALDDRVVADVTGDGLLDQLLILKLSVVFVPGTAPFEFGAPTTLTSFDGISLRLNVPVDLDRDGREEFATSSLIGTGGPGALTTGPAGALNQETPIPGVVGRTPAGSLGAVDLDGDGDTDLFGVIAERVFISENLSDLGVGTDLCVPSQDNSAGLRSNLDVFGPASASAPSLSIFVSELPPNVFGLVFGGPSVAPPSSIPGAQGAFCIASPLGRYQLPGEIQSSGVRGTFTLEVGTGDLRAGSTVSAATSGLDWAFQAWHRDVGPAGPSSQLTNAVSFTFVP